MSSAPEILLAAKDRITDGWCQRELSVNADGSSGFTGDGAVAWCSKGAIWEATSWQVDGAQLAFAYLRRALGFPEDRVEGHVDPIVTFNDDPDTTKQDVIDVFDRAAALAKEDEQRLSSLA